MRTTALLVTLTIGLASSSWAQTIDIPVGNENEQYIQQIVTGSPAGATFRLLGGTHRRQSVTPRDGDRFEGASGAILSGATVLAGWTPATCGAAPCWFVSGQQQEGTVGAADCLDSTVWPFLDYPRCNRPEDVWFDDVVKRHVASLDQVAPGTWFFDYEQDRIYVGDDPSGHEVETSVTARAFGPASNVTNVVISGLIIEKYAVPTQAGAAVEVGPGSTLELSEIRDNHYAGVYNEGSLTQFSISQQNVVHHNGGFGFIGAGPNIQILANEVAFNNTTGYNPFWGAGGSKWVHTTNLLVQSNWSHHNGGPGFWTDVNNVDCVYHDNDVHFNARQGIFHEISHGCIIQYNRASWNGFGYCGDWPGYIEGAGIQVDASAGVSIHHNTLVDNCHGIGAIQDLRGTWEISDLHVYENNVTMSSGYNGLIVTDRVADPVSYFTTRNIRWEGNNYFFADPANQASFRWSPANDLTFAGWEPFHPLEGDAYPR